MVSHWGGAFVVSRCNLVAMDTSAHKPQPSLPRETLDALRSSAAASEAAALDRVLDKTSGQTADASIPSTYRKRPVTVEAIQWQGDNLEAVQAFTSTMRFDGDSSNFRAPKRDGRPAHLYVHANQTWLPIEVGEWILRDAAGFYPCKTEIFAASYEPA